MVTVLSAKNQVKF